jgi:hypothetical protein
MTFNPSVQQQAVIEWVKTGSGSAFVERCVHTGAVATGIHRRD